MGLKRRGRYPARSVSAFDITRFSRARRGGEKVPGGATGGGKEPRIEPSLFFCFVFNALRMTRFAGSARDRRTTRCDDLGRQLGAVKPFVAIPMAGVLGGPSLAGQLDSSSTSARVCAPSTRSAHRSIP